MNKNNLETMKRHIKKAAPSIKLDGKDEHFVLGVFSGLAKCGAIRLDSPPPPEAPTPEPTPAAHNAVDAWLAHGCSGWVFPDSERCDSDLVTAIQRAQQEASAEIEGAHRR